MTEITLPNTLKTIESGAFNGCTGLTGIEIPASVDTINGNPFTGCSNLSNITLDAGNACFDSRDNCHAVIESKTNKLVIGTKDTVIPATVTTIGGSAFDSCSGLTQITIPDSVTTIGGGAFRNCTGLTQIVIPAGVDWRTSGAGIFSGCTNLKSLKLAEGNSQYDSRDNCNGVIETATDTLINAYENTVIPSSVKVIGFMAYTGCDGLTDLTIPEGVTELRYLAVTYCRALQSMTIPDSMKTVNAYAVDQCNNLREIHWKGNTYSGFSAFIEAFQAANKEDAE